ncbi:MAG TPA: hypothetical protein PLD40_10580 [Kiritimatiellia bacterium]|jgi:hypothetical protein|nr:hypothetical protein [Kiritimatiellia bacterium]OQC54729.1 MAG: hypothetical protein BWX54_02151 [Verrucomicrobia bacterium ADurb.Bin018]HOE00958.1 hypothetical protein [Kiritimatiellia bacterium]HOE37353.1 hypothetical protein [Kiritimatiellia bacterium]HOR74760.1 hypothetical protein [Kiritimatiellia bacterium]
MAMKMAEFDQSGFQNIVLMLIGLMTLVMVSNVLTIISNPDNIKIGAVVTGSVYGEEEDAETFIPPKFQNMKQDPIYLDVEPTRLTIYPELKVIEERDLVFEGNDFEQFLDDVEKVRSRRYIVLLLRPGSAQFQRKLRKVIRDRGIDVGFEPWEAGREIQVVRAWEELVPEGEGGEGEAVEGTEAGATETTPAGEPAAGEESMTEAPAATETMPEPTGEGM